ncbi:TetR family transcriptional regulator [Bauldia sp.]|uniref:TetR/AcrR family transcriptional regulator n=1 Tax=Bauldia sp. TaxID=2575872 RepID=UPI003BAB0FA3
MSDPEAERKRDAEATAGRILVCAQKVFHEKGYDGATTREIAECAGVNIALIARYFGSKLGLFEKAVLPYLSLERFLNEPIDDLADRLADTYVNTAPKPGFDPFVVLLRSISNPEVGPLLTNALETQAVDPLARALGGGDARARAILIATQLAGLILRFRILQRGPESDAERDAIHQRLLRYLDALISDDHVQSARSP